jgi:hypothetical protein
MSQRPRAGRGLAAIAHKLNRPAMPLIPTQVDPRSEEFRANEGALAARIAAGGPAEAVAKHENAGKRSARERLDLLLDPGAPFLELPCADGPARPSGAIRSESNRQIQSVRRRKVTRPRPASARESTDRDPVGVEDTSP